MFTGLIATATELRAKSDERSKAGGPPRSSPSFRECQGSAEVTVNHQPKYCQASPEDQMSGINRSNTPTDVGRAGLEPATNGL